MNRRTIFKTIFPTFLLLIVLSYAIGSSQNLMLVINSLTDNISNSADPVSDFSFSPDNVCADTPIKFTNNSTGTDLSYSWNFGDGSPVSTVIDPTHIFNTATGGGTKTYTVTLTVTEKDGLSIPTEKKVTVKETPSLNVTSDREDIQFKDLKYFIVCENQPSEFTFNNAAGGTEKNTLYEINWGDGSPPFSGANWTELKHTYSVGIYDLIYSVTSENGCKVSKKYGVFIGSNPAVGLGNPGNTNVCAGETLTFPISGTENNPLGTIYTVTFSDGSPVQVFNHPAPASVSHTFSTTSCNIGGTGNFFSVKITAVNPCSFSEAMVVPIYVSEAPKPELKVNDAPFCVDTNVTIENISQLKSEVSNSGNCNSEAKFVWEISPATGWTLQSGSSLGSQPNPNLPSSWISGSKNLVPRFTTPGTYTIKLITGNRCGIKEEIKTICIIPKTIPLFTLENTEVCGPATVKATNTSTALGSCGGASTNIWTISAFNSGACGPASSSDWAFASGSNANSESPSFLFKNPGTYTIRLTSSSPCGNFFKEEKITVLPLPSINIAPIPNSCGPITITPKATVVSCASGTPTYKWTFEGGVPATSTSLDPGPVTFSSPGPKKITLEVISSCGTTTAEKTFTINELPKVDAGTDVEICNGEEIKLTGTALGGPGPFIYEWTSIPFSSFPGSNTASPTVKPNQTTVYKLTIRDQATNCISTDEMEIKVIPAPIILFDIPNQEICSGDQSNLVKITSNPPGEIIEWTAITNGVTGLENSGTSEIPIQTLINTTGSPQEVIYTAIISTPTQGNCTITPVKYIITVNPEPVHTDEKLSICSGEEFDFQPKDLISSTKFTWTLNAPVGLAGASASITPQSSIKQKLLNETVNPIDVTYSITPFLGACQGKSFDLIVTVKPAPSLIYDIPNQEICSGDISLPVQISTNPVGGSITWTSSANGIQGVIPSGTNEIPAQSLINNTGAPIDVIFTAEIANSTPGECGLAPPLYIIKVNPTPEYSNETRVVCNDLELNFQPATLVSGSLFTWTVNAPIGIKGASNSTSPQISIQQNLLNELTVPLDIIYTISPSLGPCPGQPFELKVTVQPSPSINFSIQDQEICTGSQSQAINLTSEVAGAEFSWTVDSKGVEGTTPSGTGNQIPVQNLINSTTSPITVEYKVSVATNSGESCSGVPKIYKITVNPSISLTQDISEFNGFGISCFGANDGFIKLNPTGGNGVFFFNWTGPDGFSSQNKDISSLPPGDYQVLIKDEFGCSISQTYNLKEPTALNASVISITNVLCAGDASGSIQTNIGGGITSSLYQFEWKRNGVAISSNSKNLENVLAGTYDLLVTDGNGCITSIQGIQITEPLKALVINYSKTDISCYGANDGSLKLDVSGGLPPYDIKWNFGSGQSGFDNLGPGDYTLTVSDQSGCIKTQTITIEDAPLFKIEPEVKQISCFGEKNGSIKLNLIGGVGTTTIRWDHGAELENLFNLESGFYGVTIKDATNCEIRSEFNIVEPALLQLESSLTDALDCVNPQSGAINLGISGGTPPYSIKWSNGQTSEDLTGITSGQYAVSIVDASGCTINKAFEIKRPAPISIVAFNSTNVECEPRFVEEEFKITISGGVAPYTINWSGGQISSDGKTMKTSDPGLYEVSVTDGSGCSAVQSFEVENLEIIPEAAIESAAFEQYNSYLVNFEIQFLNKSFGQISSYFWDFGDGNESFEENPKHTYSAEGEFEISLTITDVFGCTAVIKKKISVFDYYLVVPNAFTPNGDGINDTFFPKFINIESLQFWILNKWGETIYFSDEMNNQGWDGKINGEVATPGNYVYRLKFQTLDGRTQTQTDLFILLK